MGTQRLISAEEQSGGVAHHRRSRSALAVPGIFLIFGTLLGVAAFALGSGAGLSRATPAGFAAGSAYVFRR